LQTASRNAGDRLQLSDRAEIAARNARMLEDPDEQIAAFDWVWGYDVESAFADASAE
jgi:hypothetical protein